MVQGEDMQETTIPRPTEFGNAIIAYAIAFLSGNPVDVLAHLTRGRMSPSKSNKGKSLQEEESRTGSRKKCQTHSRTNHVVNPTVSDRQGQVAATQYGKSSTPVTGKGS